MMKMDPVAENLALVRRMAPFWESHMTIPVITWLRNEKLLDEKSCNELLEGISPSSPEGIALLIRDAVSRQGAAVSSAAEAEGKVEEWNRQSVALEKVLTSFKSEQQKKIGGFIERKKLKDILQQHHLTPDEMETPINLAEIEDIEMAPVRLARVEFAIGDYKKALHWLDFYLNSVVDMTNESGDLQTPVSCIWGICCCILLLTGNDATTAKHKSATISQADEADALIEQLQEGEEDRGLGTVEAHGAARCILRLADILDHSQAAASKVAAGIGPATMLSKIFSREQQLQQRAWLLHWALWLLLRYYYIITFVQGNACRNQAWSALLDWVVQERNLTCVHLLCPHLLRYYAVYGILNRKRKDHFQAIIASIGHTKNKYTDAFTSLLEALFLDFNFDQAQEHISSIAELCNSDFFLEPLKTAVNEQARLLIFETYCRIHKRINVEMIAKKVNMAPDAAERWIVNLILHARLEARIDSEKNRVQMAGAPPSLYQLVTEKTRNLSLRTGLLIQNLTRPGFGRDDEANIPRTGGRGRGRGRGWVRGAQDGFFRNQQQTSYGMMSRGGIRGGRGGRRDNIESLGAVQSNRLGIHSTGFLD